MNRSHLSGGPFHCCGCGDGTGGGTFTPSDVTGLELQLDPELGTTVNGDGEVTAWADQSGNSHNVETDEGPGAGGGAFTLDPDAFGVGLSGLVAPVGGASLASAAALPVFAAGAARTVFVVAKVDDADDGAIFISFQPSNGLSTTFALGLWNFNGNGTIFPYTDGITISQSTGEAPETFEGVTKIYAYRFDGSGQVEFSVNGLAFEPLSGTAFASETGDAGFLIGRFIGTSFQGSFKGTLGPIYGYNGALSDDEAARVIAALSERYDVGIGIRAVTATAPLASSGGATPDISFPLLSGATTAAAIRAALGILDLTDERSAALAHANAVCAFANPSKVWEADCVTKVGTQGSKWHMLTGGAGALLSPTSAAGPAYQGETGGPNFFTTGGTGTVNLISIPNGLLHYGVSLIPDLNAAASKWHVQFDMKITTAFDATAEASQGWIDPDGNELFMMGAKGSVSTTKFGLFKNVTALSTVDIDGNWHRFRFWADGATPGTAYFSVDGETPIPLVGFTWTHGACPYVQLAQSGAVAQIAGFRQCYYRVDGDLAA